MTMEKTAILLATYNGATYLAQMLDSLLGQQNITFCCYIHDDGSSDDTIEIARDYVSRFPTFFVLLEDDRVCGSAKENFFYLLKNVDADYYFFADQDDVWLPDKMEKTLSALKSLQKDGDDGIPLCAFCDMYVTDEALRVKHTSFIGSIGRDITHTRYTQLLIDNPAAGCTMCINRACRDKALEITDTSRVEMHDIWCLLVASLFGRVAGVNEPLSYYRQHETNVMGAHEETASAKIGRNLSGKKNDTLSAEREAFRRQKFSLAEEALALNGLKPDQRKVMTEFIHPKSKSRIKRIFFLRKNGFNRKDHSLFLWLWI